jgi:hypothetical protein
MLKRTVLAAALAVLLLGAARDATAQTTVTVYVFTTVDAVKSSVDRLYITGILEGTSTPATRAIQVAYSQYYSHLENCERLAMLAMTKPGQYVLEITRPSSSYDTCELRRATP